MRTGQRERVGRYRERERESEPIPLAALSPKHHEFVLKRRNSESIGQQTKIEGGRDVSHACTLSC